MFDLVIGIIHHSRKDLTINCLNSIKSHNYKIKICLIDNNPHNYIHKTVKNNFSEVDIIINKDAYGFAKNQNNIIKKYTNKFKYYMCLNNDAVLDNNTINELIIFAENSHSLGAVCPLLVNQEYKPQGSCGPIPGFLTHFFRIISISKILKIEIIKSFLANTLSFVPVLKEYFIASRGYNSTQEVPRISGACVLFTSAALNDVGLYDEQFFMYSDDSDWSIRAKKKGYKLYINTRSKVFHHVSASSNFRSLYEMENSMFKYFKKHFPEKNFSKRIISLTLMMRHLILLFISFLLKESLEKKIFHKNIIRLSKKNLFSY